MSGSASHNVSTCRIRQVPSQGRVVFQLVGELTAQTVPDIESELQPVWLQDLSELWFEVHDITFIDSHGLGFLINCATHMQSGGGSCGVIGAQGKLAAVLKTARVDRLLRTIGTMAEVLPEVPG